MANQQAALPQKYSYLTFYKHELRPLTPELERKAEVELNEVISHRDEDLEEFRNMVSKLTDLHANMSDVFLIKFLRARKYNKDRALKLIKGYYKGKKSFKHILYEDLVPSQAKFVFEKNVVTILPHPDHQGRAVMLIQLKPWNPSEVIVEDVLRALYLTTEKLLEDPSVQVNGIVGLLDLEGFTFHHLRLFRPMLAYTLVHFIQDCIPARIKAIHLIHENALVDMGYAIVKPFLKPKLKKRLFFHGHNMAGLHKHISSEHLPKAQGGTMCDEFDGSDWTKVMTDSDESFQEDFQYGYLAS